MRVHELAKELGCSSKEIVAKLSEFGSGGRNHMSTVDGETAERLRQVLSRAAAKPVPVEAAQTGPASAVKQEPVKVEAPPVPPPEKPAARKARAPKPEDARWTPGSVITVRGPMVVRELAEKLGMRPNQLVAELMSMNIFASISQKVELEVAQKVAARHDIRLEREKKIEHKTVVKGLEEEEERTDSPENLQTRAPVVTFLGHVDHGKTSLLDKIRNTMVAKGEAGGITQRIGAYTVEVKGQKITFLDTPGHEAFTAMRARGANMTDIAVIIVAADDGVMPQTKEAIQHARAASAAIIVAINKVDLPAARPDVARQQLQALGLTPEEWGGETIVCEVSAITGQGVDHLLDMILLQSEMLELRGDRERRGHGYVIEAQLEAGMGPTANLMVKRGTLRVGDAIVCGVHWGRIKALISDRGVKLTEAGPSTPVKCLGLSGVPDAGAEFRVCSIDKVARTLAEQAAERARSGQVVTPRKLSLETLFEQMESSDRLELRLVLKADGQGSLEAIRRSLEAIKSDKVSLNILLAGAGNITVNDTLLASASDAVIVGFNVSKESGVNAVAKREGVEIRLHSIIYELLDEVRKTMTGLLAPEVTETVTGHADVKEVFQIGRLGKVAGCVVSKGRAVSKSRVRVKRKGDVLHEGAVQSLRRFQNDVAEVRESQECGIRLDNFDAFESGDIIEFYEVTKTAQTL